MLQQIQFSCSGFLLAVPGWEPGHPRGLKPAARYTKTNYALAQGASPGCPGVRVTPSPERATQNGAVRTPCVVSPFQSSKRSARADVSPRFAPGANMFRPLRGWVTSQAWASALTIVAHAVRSTGRTAARDNLVTSVHGVALRGANIRITEKPPRANGLFHKLPPTKYPAGSGHLLASGASNQLH